MLPWMTPELMSRMRSSGTVVPNSAADVSAMRQALRVPFRVVDAAGETTATGFVGGAPVQVPPGGYTVVIERADGDVSETVDLAPGDASVIELK